MFEAIHEQTGIAWKAYKIWTEFEDPHDKTKHTWICCKLHKYPVTPVKLGHRKDGVLVTPHFRALTDHFCPGESDEHWNLKVQLAEAIKNKKIVLKFREKYLRYDIDETVPLENYVEVRKNNRRADVFLKLKEYDSLLGYGLVTEVQVSEGNDSLESKAIDWIKNKHSITWVDKYPDSDVLEIKYPMGLYFDIVRECNNLKWNKNKKKYRGYYSW